MALLFFSVLALCFTFLVNFASWEVISFKIANMIQIIQLGGTDKLLYQLVASLVMNPRVLRKNNNYPFKTTEEYVWFIALNKQRVVGFMPVEQRKSGCCTINNYYVDDKAEEVLPLLLSEAIAALGNDRILSSVTLTEHLDTFRKHGFEVEKEWKRYVKMRRE